MGVEELAEGGLRVERDGAVATITLNAPERRNVLSMAVRVALGDAVMSIRDDPDIRSVIITGAGNAFCSGGDLSDIATQTMGADGWRRRLKALHAWLRELLTFDKVVVTAVAGPAYGAGFSLALTGDFIIAAPSARFSMAFIRIGGVPDAGGFYTLPRIVGPQKAREIMLSGREIRAEEALALGIASEIVPEDALMARARAVAESFADASPTAVSLTKRGAMMAPSQDLDSMLEFEANAQAVAFADPAHRQAVDAFLSKQPAPFQFPHVKKG
jgi:2-(1,2-epoxy-1,2-dihydrophenyl)acetyl-CoA isomerase